MARCGVCPSLSRQYQHTGQVTTDGWEGYVVPGHELLAPRDATIVARLRAAGAIIVGHTNMPDFANADTNRSSSFGRTGNAFDVRFSPGGSSGERSRRSRQTWRYLATARHRQLDSHAGGYQRAGRRVSDRGLVSIAGIAPLDWLLDNTGPIARTVADAAAALDVMAGEDPLDPVTKGSAAKAQRGPYLQYLKVDALKGARFGVPAFILKGIGVPFHGTPADVSELAAAKQSAEQAVALDPRTRAAFIKAIDELRALGATVVADDSVLPESFARTAARVSTYAYVREGTDLFLKEFGPPNITRPPTTSGSWARRSVRRSSAPSLPMRRSGTSRSTSASSSPTRTPTATTTARVDVRSKPIWKPWIDCIWTVTCTRPSRCHRSMRRWRRTGD